MFTKFVFALALAAMFLSMVTDASAGPKSFGGGPGGVSTMVLGSGR